MFKPAYKKSENDSNLLLIKPKTIYTFSAKQMELPSLMKQLKSQSGFFPGVFTKETTFIEYLTIRENMLVALSLASDQPKRTLDLMVNEILEELNIPDSLANQPFNTLSLELSLQLQLQLNVLCNKKIILVDDWLKYESESEKQDWLFLFRHFARTKGCSFILFTSDEKLLTIGNPLKLNTDSFQSKIS